MAPSHTPRGIEAAAIWLLPSPEPARALDAAFRRQFARASFSDRSLEWYDFELEEALRRVAPILPAGSKLEIDPTIPPLGRVLWDDWREIRPKYAGYRWRIWIFQERSPSRSVKVAYGALYDTHFRYAFTYNPYPVFLVGGLEHPSGATANHAVESAWEALMDDLKLGRGRGAREVGWLRPGASVADSAHFLTQRGLVAFKLARPKPIDAPPKEASIQRVNFGEIPPQDWVRDLVSVLG